MAAARPEAMNATPVHAKVRVTVAFSDLIFVAGQHVTGKMELECRADKGLGIGLIKAELFAIQELTSRDHSATSTFLHLTRCFQGPSLPPSNAVLPFPTPGNDPLPPDYFPARKGITTFFFRFPTPESSPSSTDFGKGVAKLKYEVRATADISWKSERQTVMDRKEVDIVEAAGEPAAGTQQVIVGENGKIWMQGRIVSPFLVAGSSACVELFVKNHSSKKSSSLNLTITRHLRLPTSSSSSNALQISDALLSVPFRGPDFIVQPGTEGVASLVFTVPKNARGVRSGRLDTGEDEGIDTREMESLFSVQCLITVKMGLGFGSKDVILEIPITVVHPSAMALIAPSPSAPAPPHASFQPQRYASPNPAQNHRVSPPQQPHAYRTPYMSPPSSPHPMQYYQSPYHSPPISPPPLHMNHWFPPQSPQDYPYNNEQYFYPPPPVPLAHSLPLRPSSADPFIAQQLPLLPLHQQHHQNQQQTANNHLAVPDLSALAPEPEAAEGEVGKGERASRISAHLRHSSRTRSVSPQSHRFPAAIPMTVTESNDEGTTVAAPASSRGTRPLPIPRRSRKSGDLQDASLLSPTSASNNQNGKIHSPRPVLSPKHSFSVDRGTVKSERVERLEELAAREVEDERSKPDISNDKEAQQLQQPYFIDVDSPGTPKLPPQPTLVPIGGTLLKPVPSAPSESGLDALERKLLAQVGTRKPDSSRRADVRTILPITIPSRSDPRVDPANDSAISSLALGAEFLREEGKSPPSPLEDEPKSKSYERRLPTPTKEKPGESSTTPQRRVAKRREFEKRTDAHELKKAAKGRVAAWLGGLDDAASPPLPSTPPSNSSLAASDDEDSLFDRVDHDPHPLLRSPINDIAREKVESESQRDHGQDVPTRSSGFVLHATLDSSPFSLPNPFDTPSLRDGRDEPSIEPPKVEMSSAGSESIPKPVLKRFTLQPPISPSESKYDVRSARGGRGGKVTSVAAIWASKADSRSDASTPTNQGPPPLPRKDLRPPQPRAATSAIPQRFERPPLKPVPQSQSAASLTNGDARGEVTARRAKMVKATSVPAVISSSLATPMISSSASLARPGPSAKRFFPPSATATSNLESPVRPAPKPGNTNFGQARLKDLIRKYQEGQ